MYISRNLYDPEAQYINLSDQDFFKEALATATENYYQHKEQLAEADIQDKFDEVKHQATPVFYGTTVAKKTADDDVRPRIEINQRLRRKFIVLDMDFNAEQADLSKWLYNYLIDFAKYYHCQLVIYPTASYPEKPRFRAVIFVKNQLNQKTYWQAAHWVADQITRPVNLYKSQINRPNSTINVAELMVNGSQIKKFFDKGYDNILSNNNVPVFISEEQVNAVYTNLDDNQFKPLAPKADELWRTKDYQKAAGKKFRKPKDGAGKKQAADDDHLEFSEDDIKRGVDTYIKSGNADSYETFWKFIYSVARAVYVGQIGSGTAELMLRQVASAAPDKTTEQSWAIGNLDLYRTAYSRIDSGKVTLDKIKPLAEYSGFYSTKLLNQAAAVSALLNQG